MIKLGLSTRLFILQGPPDDEEPESELSVTEMKDMRNKEKLAEQLAKARGEPVKDDAGIDWGMGLLTLNHVFFFFLNVEL